MLAPWLSAVLCILAAGADKYPRADLLVEPADLVKPDTLTAVRVLDARGKAGYNEGHIPGAVWVDITTWGRTFAKDQTPATWAKLLGGLGLAPDSRVVVYGTQVNETARLWWLLRYWGVRDVRLLNGGWKGWQQAGGKVSKDVPLVQQTVPTLTPHPDRLMTKDQMLKALKDKLDQIIDARSTREFCGEANTARRNGAIPGALHRDWVDLLDPQTGRFKSAAELARIFKETGIDTQRPAVTYCQSGGRAAAMAFALELMGVKDVRNYYRSWAEWGNAADTPVVKPAPKK